MIRVPEIDKKSNIYANSMLEKVMQKTWEVLQNGAQMGATIDKKSLKNEVRKSMRKKGPLEGGAGEVGG